jgi:hypothetical protein
MFLSADLSSESDGSGLDRVSLCGLRRHSGTLAQTTVLAPPVHYVTRRGVEKWRLQRGTGRGNRSTGERLSQAPRRSQACAAGLASPLPALRLRHGTRAVASLRLLVIPRSTQQPFSCAVKLRGHPRTLAHTATPSLDTR